MVKIPEDILSEIMEFKKIFPGIFSRRKDEDLHIQFFRYTIVGGIAYIVDFGSLYLLTEFGGLHYLLSAMIAFILGLITNYSLSIIWVFARRRVTKVQLEFTIFTLIGVVGLVLTELFMWLFTGIFGIFYLISKILTGAIVYLWNFSARKFILFR